MSELRHATGAIPMDHCLVMGTINRTPDSFYDGGRMDLDDAIGRGVAMVAEGADLLDLGAVKAGPGEDVSEQEERDRLIPLVVGLAEVVDVPLSVETARPAVAAEAIAAGAGIVNDVTSLAEPALAGVCASADAAIVLMHNGGQMRGRPRAPRYEDVVSAVTIRWKELLEIAFGEGVSPQSVIVDPGLDFGKTTFHSLELVRRLDELVELGWPVLVAPSRKDVVGETLDLEVGDRLEGTLALVALAVASGAAIVRVHDVGPTVRVVRMVEAVKGRRSPAAPVRGLWD